MDQQDSNRNSFNRRRFISDAMKWAALAGLLVPLEQACGNKSQQKDKSTGNKEKDPNKKNAHVVKHNRKKWHHEGLLNGYPYNCKNECLYVYSPNDMPTKTQGMKFLKRKKPVYI